MLNDFGIWQGPHSWHDLQTMPRYFPGRPILVKATVDIEHSSPSYMEFVQNSNLDKYVTHRAELIGIDAAAKQFIVNIDGKTDGPI